jgi:hypothetical protein
LLLVGPKAIGEHQDGHFLPLPTSEVLPEAQRKGFIQVTMRLRTFLGLIPLSPMIMSVNKALASKTRILLSGLTREVHVYAVFVMLLEGVD